MNEQRQKNLKLLALVIMFIAVMITGFLGVRYPLPTMPDDSGFSQQSVGRSHYEVPTYAPTDEPGIVIDNKSAGAVGFQVELNGTPVYQVNRGGSVDATGDQTITGDLTVNGNAIVAGPTVATTATPMVSVNTAADVVDLLVISKDATPVVYVHNDGTLDMNGNKIDLDANANTSITADTDDIINFEVSGTDEFTMTASLIDINANKLVLDLDADTSLTADTDDQIDIEISGADDFQFTANLFEVLSGSAVKMNGGKLDLDADDDTSIIASTDNQIDIEIAASNEYTITGALFDFGGNCLDLDEAGTTSLCVDTNNQIDIEINGADDFQFIANLFEVLSGSAVKMNGGRLDLDADDDTSIIASTDNQIDIEIAASNEYTITGSLFDFGGNCLDLDEAGTTSICADTNDQINIEIGGANDFQFTANIFTILAGSKINSASVTTGTHGIVFQASGTHGHASAEADVSIMSLPANANVVDAIYVVGTQWNDGTSAVVDCGIANGDLDAFVDNMNINDAGDFNRIGDAADMPYATTLIDVGGSDVNIICTVAEGTNDASAGAATLYLWYIID